jgi:hypothetical protein
MKTHSTFQKALDKIDAKIQELHEQAFSVRRSYQDGNIKQAYESALRLEEVSEKTVLLTRALPAYTGNPKARLETENLIKLSIPIEIGFTEEGWFSLRIPALLPKKDAGSADYIRSSLYLAMREFFLDSQPVRYNDCVLIYRHIYARDRPERKKRDHDNIEVNMVSDIVAMYVLPDDGPSVCSHYYCSAQGQSDRTEVYVVPQCEFTGWLENEKQMPEQGVKLYEKRL